MLDGCQIDYTPGQGTFKSGLAVAPAPHRNPHRMCPAHREKEKKICNQKGNFSHFCFHSDTYIIAVKPKRREVPNSYSSF